LKSTDQKLSSQTQSQRKKTTGGGNRYRNQREQGKTRETGGSNKKARKLKDSRKEGPRIKTTGEIRHHHHLRSFISKKSNKESCKSTKVKCNKL
jgi:hypothetical protein